LDMPIGNFVQQLII